MASTNINTNNAELSTDIYDIANYINDIRIKNISDIDDTSSMVGIFGYLTEVFSQSLQDTIIMVSETSNETIPTKAKFSKNILAHAMNLAIKNITAQPATMTMMIYLPINGIENNFVEYDSISGKGKFILDRNVPIYIDNYEYHLDYDVILNRIKNSNGSYVYTAMYDLFTPGTTTIKQNNPISDISNPYITTLLQTTVNNIDYIAFSARLHQVSLRTVEKNILTDNIIENKSMTFEFEEQLSCFDVDVVESDGTIKHLIPIYYGLLDYTVEDNNWCYYEYVNENTIRILFSRDSYIPGLNATVKVNITLSDGSNGNFTYNEDFRTGLTSEKYNNYSGMYALIYPLMNGVSNGGKDKKSISDLKKIIPRENSSRGAIINTTDLNNYFNSINDDQSHIYFYKKRDNPFERLYYAYMIMRKNGTVYPTNTLNLSIEQSDFKGFSGNNNLMIPPGTTFYYYDHGTDTNSNYATIKQPQLVEGLDRDEYPHDMTTNVDGNLVRVFEYISPFLIAVDDDLIASYLLTIMNDSKTFKFESINTESDLQFVATNMRWERKYIYTDTDDDGNTVKKLYDNKYTMYVDMIQNTNNNAYELVKTSTDSNGEKIYSDIRIKIVMVLYEDNTDSNPYRYLEGELYEYDGQVYTFKFTMTTDDMLDLNNRINIGGLYHAKPESIQSNSLETYDGYMNSNTYAKIFILADFGTKEGDTVNNTVVTSDTEEIILYGTDGKGNRTELESIIPIREDIINAFLNNEIYITRTVNGVTSTVSVTTIMKENEEYKAKYHEYNGDQNDDDKSILRYLRNNRNSEFVTEVLLNDRSVNDVIDSFVYEDYSRYTVCNVLSIDGGIDFYRDYSNMMTSSVSVSQVQETDENGNLVYKQIKRTDSLGNTYYECMPRYLVNENGTKVFSYKINRIPMIKKGFLSTESSMQDFIYDLEERRKYITECLYVLEDTFGIDFKFVNTYGPSRRFYYIMPNEKSYNVIATAKQLLIYADKNDSAEVIGSVVSGTVLNVSNITGAWGYIQSPFTGWIRLSDTTRETSYIDNVAISLKFALEAESSADKFIADNIVSDIKEYIETINTINEIHMPNIITLITNNYREQLKYFEFLGVNEYGIGCQHLYLNESSDADICPEFINIATKDDIYRTPDIDIAVY